MSAILSMGECLQPQSVEGKTNVTDLVIEDLHGRIRLNKVKYPYPLQTDNGRDAEVDAYHESLDLCQYLRQSIEERLTRVVTAQPYITFTEGFTDDNLVFGPQVCYIHAVVYRPAKQQPPYLTFVATDVKGREYLLSFEFTDGRLQHG